MRKKGYWTAAATAAVFGVLSVSAALPGCGGGGSGLGINNSGSAPIVNPFLGNFASTVALNGTSTGTFNMGVQNNGVISGTLVINDPTRSATPRVIFNSAVHGNANMTTGEYFLSGSFIETNKQTIPVTVSGHLPGESGTAGTVVIQFSGNRFTGNIFAGSLANPTARPSPSPSPSPTPSSTPPNPP